MGETDALRRRHRDYFLSLAEEAEPKLTGAEQMVWLQRLELEHANLLTALEQSLGAVQGAYQAPEIEQGLRLAGALWRFWYIRGYCHEGRFWLKRLLQQESVVVGSVRSKALNGAANLAYQCQDYTQAQGWFQERLEFEQAQGNLQALAGTLGNLANVTSELGCFTEARALFELSLAHFRDLKDTGGIIKTLGNLAVVSWKEGQLPEACAFHEECAEFFGSAGDRNSRAVALNNSADIRITLQEYARAAMLLRESLEIGRALESRPTLVHCLTLCYFLLARRGTLEPAATLLGATEALFDRVQFAPAPRQRRQSTIATRSTSGQRSMLTLSGARALADT